MGVPHFNAVVANIRISFFSPETRGIVLPDAENHMIVPSFLWTQYRNVSDERTDRRNPSGYYSALHCGQFGRALKTQKCAFCRRITQNIIFCCSVQVIIFALL